jgi:hypothetical protein
MTATDPHGTKARRAAIRAKMKALGAEQERWRAEGKHTGDPRGYADLSSQVAAAMHQLRKAH